jgi:16S rRNA processing protein RimM
MGDSEAAVELLVGRVGRAHGIRGDVAIEVRTDEPERRFADGTEFRTRRGRLTIASTRWHGQRLLARFEGVADRTDAEQLRGVELRLTVDAGERPDDPEEFYDHQLVGLEVLDAEGALLGSVREILHLPSQDVLALDLTDGREVLVPFVTEFVPTVDLAAGRVVVAPPPGLLDPEDESPSSAGGPDIDGSGS